MAMAWCEEYDKGRRYQLTTHARWMGDGRLPDAVFLSSVVPVPRLTTCRSQVSVVSFILSRIMLPKRVLKAE